MIIIYKIENLINGKLYVGSTSNKFNRRCNQHRSLLRQNKHGNPHLQNSWNKYGESSFKFSIIEMCNDGQRVEKEEHYKNLLTAQYNIAPIVQPLGTMRLGKKHTPETIEKMRLAHRGHKMPVWFSAFASKMNSGENNGMYGRTGEKGSRFSGYFVWKHPTIGEEHLSQTEMVKKYSLIGSNLYHLTTGKRKSHRGWECKGKVK